MIPLYVTDPIVVMSQEFNNRSPTESDENQQRKSSPVSKEYLRLFQAETFKLGERIVQIKTEEN